MGLHNNDDCGDVVIEGKTKVIFRLRRDPESVLVVSKDDITAGDGAKHDTFEGKGRFSNETTCNVFRLLQRKRIPVAFYNQQDSNSFMAPKCHMLPYEVVVRREALGSYLKRNPEVESGYRFKDLVVEFFLKTNGKQWNDHPLPCDDPLMFYDPDTLTVQLHEPTKPVDEEHPFLMLSEDEVFRFPDEADLFQEMERIAILTFRILERAWRVQGQKLVDFKVEFGRTEDGRLLLADVIDNDSWRLIERGEHLDKQVYRDGGDLQDVARKYARVMELTSRF